MQQKDNTLTYILVFLGILIGGGLFFYWWQNRQPQDTSNGANGSTNQNTNTGGGKNNTGGSGGNTNTSGGGSGGAKKINVIGLGWGSRLASLKTGFSEDGLVAQAILRYKGFKGKDGKDLTLDGKVGPNTQAAIKSFWAAEKVDYDDQDLNDLFQKSKVDMTTVLNSLKNEIEKGTKNQYTV